MKGLARRRPAGHSVGDRLYATAKQGDWANIGTLGGATGVARALPGLLLAKFMTARIVIKKGSCSRMTAAIITCCVV